MHEKQKEFLKRKFELGQLSHAYLFAGSNGLGKKDFAKKFGEHIGLKFPDLMFAEPEENKEISIAKIREIQNFLSYKSYNGGYKTVVINNAHLMSIEAQNCFLKTLEEPKGKTLIILISSRPDLILPTVFSRCQPIKFFGRPKETAEQEEESKEILNKILKVINSDLSAKFKYAKEEDPDSQKLQKIILALQKHYREFLPTDQKSRRILKMIDEINFKTTFSNVNTKLALEILLLNI